MERCAQAQLAAMAAGEVVSLLRGRAAHPGPGGSETAGWFSFQPLLR